MISSIWIEDNRNRNHITQLAKLVEGWDPPKGYPQPNTKLRARIASMIGNGNNRGGRTELDSHANMMVFGNDCEVISLSGKTVEVGAFSESAGGLSDVPIADVIVAYDCKRSNETYLLISRNVLYIDDMDDNLIPPFIMRQAGLIVSEIAKIHCDPDLLTEDIHTIQHLESGLFIPLHLRSIFSYFETRKPTDEDLCDGIPVMISPDAEVWQPYCQVLQLAQTKGYDTTG